MHATDIMGSGIDTVFNQLARRAYKWFDDVKYLTVKTDYSGRPEHILVKLPIDSRSLRNMFFVWPPALVSSLGSTESSDAIICSTFPMAVPYILARRPLKCFIGWGRAPIAPYSRAHEQLFLTLGGLIEREALRNADIRLSPSRFVQKIYERDRIQTTCMYIDGVDFAIFDEKKFKNKAELKKRFVPETSKKVISFVSRIAPHKNIEMLISAMSRVAVEDNDSMLLIAGSTDFPYYYERLMSLIKHLDISDSVRFLGRLNWTDLAALYAATDVYVSPSLWEGTFRAEPFAMKVPMVAFDMSSASETIQDNITGRLVRHISSDALANAIIDLLGDETRRRKMGEAGYEWAMANLNFDRIAEKLFPLILKRLENRV
jgi:glycosyltransferase involved in cell wall biosynthesis